MDKKNYERKRKHHEIFERQPNELNFSDILKVLLYERQWFLESGLDYFKAEYHKKNPKNAYFSRLLKVPYPRQ